MLLQQIASALNRTELQNDTPYFGALLNIYLSRGGRDALNAVHPLETVIGTRVIQCMAEGTLLHPPPRPVNACEGVQLSFTRTTVCQFTGTQVEWVVIMISEPPSSEALVRVLRE